MLAQADHNNMGSLSKQHERNKMAGGMPPHPPRIVWRFRHKKHRTLAPLAQSPATQQAFHALETLRLESSVTCLFFRHAVYQLHSQGLSSLLPLSLRTMEAEKGDPGNEAGSLSVNLSMLPTHPFF